MIELAYFIGRTKNTRSIEIKKEGILTWLHYEGTINCTVDGSMKDQMHHLSPFKQLILRGI